MADVSMNERLIDNLHRLNPYWRGDPLPVLPKTRRHLVAQIKRRMEMRLAPVVVVRGPRQIGKTTAQLQILDDLLAGGVSPQRILRLQTDELPTLLNLEEPLLSVVGWFEREILKKTLNAAAREGKPAYLFFDEVQNLKDWAPQIKSLVDASTVTIIVTGSSALRIEQGRDSLAGRITTVEAGVLSLTEIAMFRNVDLGGPFLVDNGLGDLADKAFWQALIQHGHERRAGRDEVFKAFSERGGYPLVHERAKADWPALAAQLNETVIKRVIQHDLRVGAVGRRRDGSLLEELFRLACRYVGQSPGVTKLAEEVRLSLDANIGPQRVRSYLQFLGDTLLLRLIEPLEIRLKKQRAAAKICLADHGLRRSWLGEYIPIDTASLEAHPHLKDLAGRVAESVVGITLKAISGLDTAYLPAKKDQPEIDFIVTIGAKRIPIEVKYQQPIRLPEAIHGLRTFMNKAVNNAPFGLLITRDEIEQEQLAEEGIVALSLATFMLLR
jgi:hypothetical protein